MRFVALIAVTFLSVFTMYGLVALPQAQKDMTHAQAVIAARAYCATQVQAHYCFEVAMQEGLDWVMGTS